MKLKYFICCLWLSILSICMQAQTEVNIPKPVANAVKISRPIELSGRLDDPQWKDAQAIELKYEVLPGDNLPAKEKTVVRILYDDNNIYFGFECFDSNPQQIRANYTDRDKIFDDDYVQIMIDTYNDYQKGYSFAVNPYGIKADLSITASEDNLSLDWVWNSAASKNNNGWIAEMAIPFSSLSFANNEEQTWGLHLFRIMPRGSQIRISWNKNDRNNVYDLPQTGILKGLTNLKSKENYELLPYVIGQQSGARTDMGNPGSNFNYNKFQSRVGVGLKYSPNSNVTIDAVINPDFSQIESDADQISVNTTFALQYEEKRPFFLAGSDLFGTPFYYSRSINDPLAAARIKGKSGTLSYYLMSAYDRNTVFMLAGGDRSNTIPTNLKSLVNIGRLRYELSNESYIGLYIITRDISGGHGYNISADWNLKFWDKYYFLGEAAVTHTKELNDTTIFKSDRRYGNTGYDATFNGEQYWSGSLMAGLLYNSRSYRSSYYYTVVSPNQLTYTGSLSGNDYHAVNISHRFIYYPENSFIDQGDIQLATTHVWDFGGFKKNQSVTLSINQVLKGQTSVGVSYVYLIEEGFNKVTFHNTNYFRFYVATMPVKEISFSANGQIGRMIYRTANPVIGSGHELTASVTLKPTSQLNLSLSYSRARLSNVNTNELFYDGNIYRLVGIYQFSPEIFFRTILQYNTFENKFQVYPLFSYKLNAFTTFFAGATSDYYGYQGMSGIVNTNQQYFIKLQYLLGL